MQKLWDDVRFNTRLTRSIKTPLRMASESYWDEVSHFCARSFSALLICAWKFELRLMYKSVLLDGK